MLLNPCNEPTDDDVPLLDPGIGWADEDGTLLVLERSQLNGDLFCGTGTVCGGKTGGAGGGAA